MKLTSKNALMVSLGHNSSALFYDGVNKPVGYEEERLNGLKSCSAFPILAIEKIIEEVGEKAFEGATLMVSHWFDSYDFANFKEKYFDAQYVSQLMKKYNMKNASLSGDFTHHDAHAYSSKAFLKYSLRKNHSYAIDGSMHYIVADGFGNKQEVLSIYKDDPQSPELKLLSRIYGYNNSLGLLYQYATSFCNMKENQDEYKFLGYEANILDVASEKDLQLILSTALAFSESYMSNFSKDPADFTFGSYINLHDLDVTKKSMYLFFHNVIKQIGRKDDTTTRIIIGHLIQTIVETILSKIIAVFEIKNVCLSGGCFYNVKLNNSILKNVSGYVCVIPLAGDQGAAIGLYERQIGAFDFDDLCYGNRNLRSDIKNSKRIIIAKSEEEFVATVITLLESNKIVNILTGSMEFGPRALCNTSTLALPTKVNVDYINKLNSRNTVMPMAPVILDFNVNALFDDKDAINRTVGSNDYMIMTHDFNDEAAASEKYAGVRHKYPDKSRYSGRPQIINSKSDKPIRKILTGVKSLCLINTSFNTHGTPILYSLGQCIFDFQKQNANDDLKINYLVVLDA